jgi:hypothetical protein
LEWDDFISWEHETPAIEAIRQSIASTEPMFFSSDADKRMQGRERLLEQRNRLAAMLGLSLRDMTETDRKNAT